MLIKKNYDLNSFRFHLFLLSLFSSKNYTSSISIGLVVFFEPELCGLLCCLEADLTWCIKQHFLRRISFLCFIECYFIDTECWVTKYFFTAVKTTALTFFRMSYYMFSQSLIFAILQGGS